MKDTGNTAPIWSARSTTDPSPCRRVPCMHSSFSRSVCACSISGSLCNHDSRDDPLRYLTIGVLAERMGPDPPRLLSVGSSAAVR